MMEYDRMDLEEINKMWSKDCKIDETNITSEARRIPEMHNKYYTLYVKAALKVKKLKADLAILQKAKTEYYSGSMDQAELQQRGWKPNPLKILRQDMDKYMDSDRDIIELSLTIDYHLSIANYLEDIIKQINNRNFLLSNIINWEKFRAGGN
jgi:hypothetical protein